MSLRVCLFGVPGADRNLGVAALRTSVLDGILARERNADVTVFDDGWGVRSAGGHRLAGARDSRRLHRPESYRRMWLAAKLGMPNRNLAFIDGADAVLDVSGGDSFTDLYGLPRFRTVAWPKRLTLMRKRPLVFLPQTYGPFRKRGPARAEAVTLLRAASAAWARDADSHATMLDLLGPDADPRRHRQGVDLAFGLAPAPPGDREREAVEGFLADGAGPVVGLNVSGLLLHGRRRFGMRADPWSVVSRLVPMLLDDGAKVLLVPHVRTPGQPDDDTAVTASLAERLRRRYPYRVAAAPEGLGPRETKWLIGRTDWFCGMRMHAAIAALSQSVPTAVVAYSRKARGVFAGLGQQRRVADGRRQDTDEVVEVLWCAWRERAGTADGLARRLPEVLSAAAVQLDDLVRLLREPTRP